MYNDMAKKQTNGGVADEVRGAFKRSGWSILRWSKESGVPYMSCHEFVNKNRAPMITTMEKLTAALGLRLVVEDRTSKKRKSR